MSSNSSRDGGGTHSGSRGVSAGRSWSESHNSACTADATGARISREAVDLLKKRVRARLDELDRQLRGLNLKIHEHPEFGFEEHKASEWLTEFLSARGFEVERGIAGLATAFKASYAGRSKAPRVALMVEYDALPETGHGCGHSMIGPIGAGAATALKDIWPDLPGEVMVIGTPAEEEGGGKVFMVKQGVFNSLDAVAIAHPTNMTMIGGTSLAMKALEIEFLGKPAHACSNPQMGVNALSALVHTFNLIDGQRQQFHKDVRVNGVITNGGEAPNIIPGYASAKFQIMAPDDRMLESVVARVTASAEAAATAIGADVRLRETIHYQNKLPSAALGKVFAKSLFDEGFPLEEDPGDLGWGYTDTGDVSHVAPTVSIYFRIAGPGVFNHTLEFSEAVKGEQGQEARLRVTKAVACALVDLFSDPSIFAEAQRELEAVRSRELEMAASQGEQHIPGPTT